jgi:hypothetical protein
MSALGQKRTFALQQGMSALPPKATAKADMVCVTPAALQSSRPHRRRLASYARALSAWRAASSSAQSSLGRCPLDAVLLLRGRHYGFQLRIVKRDHFRGSLYQS